MFEKEAEEYVPNIKWHDFSSKDLREEMMLCYRKGAEFGYNKALEEATHNYNAIIADYDKRIAELAKANEWHYPSKGEYPKDNSFVLVWTEDGGITTNYGEEYSDGISENGLFQGIHISDVIAWKEIVLPKEIKEK